MFGDKIGYNEEEGVIQIKDSKLEKKVGWAVGRGGGGVPMDGMNTNSRNCVVQKEDCKLGEGGGQGC